MFPPSTKDRCLGTETRTLPTADYTLVGYEDLFVIERKRSTAEIATNLFEDRFERELVRMEAIPHAFLVCEFTLQDVLDFPRGSGIPREKWGDLRTSGPLLLKKLNEILVVHHIPIIYAGTHGWATATSLFKRVLEHVQRPD